MRVKNIPLIFHSSFPPSQHHFVIYSEVSIEFFNINKKLICFSSLFVETNLGRLECKILKFSSKGEVKILHLLFQVWHYHEKIFTPNCFIFINSVPSSDASQVSVRQTFLESRDKIGMNPPYDFYLFDYCRYSFGKISIKRKESSITLVKICFLLSCNSVLNVCSDFVFDVFSRIFFLHIP